MSLQPEMQKQPVIITDITSDITSESGSVVPYVFGWFLGVPTSVLFLIFLLRGCH